jgi:two-component system, OmpR family, sensor histidine kinase MprB
VRFEVSLEPAVVEGSRDRLARAVNNLLDNAAKHSPPGGVVEVEAVGGGVRVRDHGAGVAEEDIPHLFDRFYRGVSARGRPGSGLGLAIVRQVAEQHHGTVRAANAPGGGAEFTLSLPAIAPTGDQLWATRA